MPRKRLRPDWPVIVYKFHATPVGDLPEAIWMQAKAMQALWNRLLEVREKALEALEPILASLQAAKQKNDSPKIAELDEQRKAAWQTYETQLLKVASNEQTKEQLNWESREFVYNRFRTASRATLKTGAHMRPKSCLRSIVMPHRYLEGGKPIEDLLAKSGGKFSIKPVDPSLYETNTWHNRRGRNTTGTFAIGPRNDTVFVFHATLHRPFPAGAIVKYACWCGYNHPSRGWQWTIQLTMEVPPDTMAAPPGFDDRPLAGLDLGWRKFDNYLRIGVVHDTMGHSYEVRLPLEERPPKSLRRLQRLMSKHGKDALHLPVTLQDIWAWQRNADRHLEETKAALKTLNLDASHLPEDVQGVIANLDRIRNGGLIRLLRTLEQMNGNMPPGFTEAKARLREWYEQSSRCRKEIDDARDRLIRRRQHIYENLARWLFREFRAIVWEGDLDLKGISELTAKASMAGVTAALRQAAKYRHFACLSSLRLLIKRADLHGALVGGQSAKSTVNCDICRAECERSPKLHIVCPNGHKQDQDVRSARNLLLQFLGEGKAAIDKQRQVSIPPDLRTVIVPLD